MISLKTTSFLEIFPFTIRYAISIQLIILRLIFGKCNFTFLRKRLVYVNN